MFIDVGGCFCDSAVLAKLKLFDSTQKVSGEKKSWGLKIPWLKFIYISAPPTVSGSQVSLAHHPNDLQPALVKESWPQHWTKGQGGWQRCPDLFILKDVRFHSHQPTMVVCQWRLQYTTIAGGSEPFFLAQSSRSPHDDTLKQINIKTTQWTVWLWFHTPPPPPKNIYNIPSWVAQTRLKPCALISMNLQRMNYWTFLPATDQLLGFQALSQNQQRQFQFSSCRTQTFQMIKSFT